MTDFNEMLNRDADESVAWARSLPLEQSELAARHFFSVLADKEGTALRRLNAASILNALASSRPLTDSIATQALSLLPGLLHEDERDLRRNGLVALSSTLHSVARSLPPKRRDLYRGLLEACAEQVTDEWDRGKIRSMCSVLAPSEVKGGRLELFDSVVECAQYKPPVMSLLAASFDRVPQEMVLSAAAVGAP